MFTFADTILKLLNNYKLILRKQLTHREWSQKLNELGLKRKFLKQTNEIELYNKAQRVLADLKLRLRDEANTASWYSGIDEFYNHLKGVLENYTLSGNRIVHTSRKASQAMVEAIQLMKSPHVKYALVAQKLDKCGQTIAKYGTKEQQEIFAKALKNFQSHDVNLFTPLLNNFEKYIHQFTALFTEEEYSAEA